MRRIVTGHNDNGKSVIKIDGPPARSIGEEIGGLFEIWNEDGATIDMKSSKDRALSLLLFISIVAPSSFHISNKPPISSPIDRAGGPSILITDLPLSLCPVTILLT